MRIATALAGPCRLQLSRLRPHATRPRPGGARDDYDNAVRMAGGVIRYLIDALVADAGMVAAAWTGTTPNGAEFRGLALYRVSGGLLRSTRHAVIGNLPA